MRKQVTHNDAMSVRFLYKLYFKYLLYNGEYTKESRRPYFTLESNLESSNLVQASQLLLSRLRPKLKQSFLLVVMFLEEKACFRLCLVISL
jgi:hypothetical protein